MYTETFRLFGFKAGRKVLRVCVNNNSIPASSEGPLTETRLAAGAAMLSEDATAPLNESARWRWLANLSRSRSVPNVTQSHRETCFRRKAMSEERVTEGSTDRPSKRRRLGHPMVSHH